MLENNNTQEAQDVETPEREGKHLSELAQQTQRILTGRKWSLRQAEIQTGVGYSTVSNMKKGMTVEPEALIKWARAIKERPDDWLGFANKPFRSLHKAARKVELPSGLVVEVYAAEGDEPPVVTEADRAALAAFFGEPQ